MWRYDMHTSGHGCTEIAMRGSPFWLVVLGLRSLQQRPARCIASQDNYKCWASWDMAFSLHG